MKKYFLLLLFYILNSIFYISLAQSPNTWTQRASFPGVPRISAVGFTIDQKAYVGTGLDSSNNLLNDFWEYDPATNSWSQLADFSGGTRRGAVGFAIGTKGYVGCGFDGTNNLRDFWEYDPSLNSWTQKKKLGGNATTNGRRESSAFSINNKGYVVTGYDGTNIYNRETWQFDGDTTWVKKADIGSFFSLGRRWSVAFEFDTVAFWGCGYNYLQDYKKDFWRYNFSTNIWTQKADFGGTGRSTAVAFTSRGRGFIGTGNNQNYLSDFWQYNPVTNTWFQIIDFPAAMSGGVGFTVNDTGYAGLGHDSILFRSDLWQYSPDSTIGINEINDERVETTIFPNPFSVSAVLNIKDDRAFRSGNLSFILYDLNGNKIRQELFSKNSLVIERKNLSAGVYVYSIRNNSTQKVISSGKIVIQ